MINKIDSKFVIDETPSIRNKILSDLEIILEMIFSVIDKEKIVSIILGGGFGRGEGSVFFENGKVIIINDYDLDIILRKKINSAQKYFYLKKLNEMSKTTAEKINIKQIDLSVLELKEFLSPKNEIVYYELINNYKVIYGEDVLINLKNNIDLEIPLWEGLWLYRNRGLGLLINQLYLKNNSFGEREKQNFWIEYNKAIQAIGDAYLVQIKNYLPTLKERLEFFLSGKVKHPISELYIDEVKQKLYGRDKVYADLSGILEKYEKVLPLFVISMEEFLNRFSLMELSEKYFDFFENPLLSLNFYKNLVRASFINFRKRILAAELKRNKLLSIFAVYLLLKYKVSDFNDKLTENELKKIFFIYNNLSYEKFFYEAIKFFLLSIHPTGEAGRIARL